jgi:hypothetical protein
MTVWADKNRSLPAGPAAAAAVAAEAAPLGAALEGIPGAAREGVPGTGSGAARAATRKPA